MAGSLAGAEVDPVPGLESDRLVAEAKAASAAHDWEKARELYLRALLSDPANEQVLHGLATVDEVLAGRASPPRVDGELGEVRHQLALVEARAAAEGAEILVNQGRSAEARELIQRARECLLTVDRKTDVDQDLKRIEARIAAIEPRVQDDLAAGAAADRAVALADAKDRIGRSEDIRQGVYAERLERAKGYLTRRHFELALAASRQLVLDFPGQPETEALFEEALAGAHAQRKAETAELDIELRKRVMERLEDSLLPVGFDARPIYPADWLDRHQDQIEVGGEDAELESWHEALLDRLAVRLNLDFDAVAVEEALAVIAGQAGINLVVDPAVYANGGQPVSLRVTDMRVDAVLNWLATMTGNAWTIAQGAVYFGGGAVEERVLAVYDLAHILRVPYDQPGKTLSFNSGGGGAGGAFDLFQDAGAAPEPIAPEDIVDLIRDSVSPTTWDQPENAIVIRGNHIYVTAPRSAHALLREFIRSQARAQSLAVHVAAKWLTVDDTYLEEIGVNWGSAESLVHTTPGVIPPGYRHQTGTQYGWASALNRLPANAIQVQPATAGTGLNLSLLRIGNTEVAAVLTAVERKGQGRILASPELTTLNGIRGSVFFGLQYAYIADYEVVANNLDPVIEVLNIGSNLDIKPYVSADRKYVTMEFQQAIASVTFFTELIIAPRVIGAGNGTGVVIPGNPYPIELPNVAIDEVGTMIIVPDHGSLMVGGFGNHIEESGSSKVPFLGHIPFLGRLFGVRGRYSQRKRLYLLATVDIIHYQEAEDNL